MKNFDIIAYGIFVAIIAFLTWQLLQLENRNAALRASIATAQAELEQPASGGGGARQDNRSSLPGIALPYLVDVVAGSGDVFRFPSKGRSTTYLFIFFTYSDCYSGFANVSFWSELRREFDESVSVIGVTTAGFPEKVRYFVEKQGIMLPVIYDATGELFDTLTRIGYSATPLMLLTDSDGKILHAGGTPANSSEAQAEYKRLLRTLTS